MKKNNPVGLFALCLSATVSIANVAQAQSVSEQFSNQVCRQAESRFSDLYNRFTERSRAAAEPVVREHVRRLQAFYNGLSAEQRTAIEYRQLEHSENEAERIAFRRSYGRAMDAYRDRISQFRTEMRNRGYCHGSQHPLGIPSRGFLRRIGLSEMGQWDVRIFNHYQNGWRCFDGDAPPRRVSDTLVINRPGQDPWLVVCSHVTDVTTIDHDFSTLFTSQPAITRNLEVRGAARVCSALNIVTGEIRGNTVDLALRSPYAVSQNNRDGGMAALLTMTPAEFIRAQMQGDHVLNRLCVEPQLAAEQQAALEAAEPAAPEAPSCIETNLGCITVIPAAGVTRSEATETRAPQAASAE
jgi:hypothetical protein